MPRQAGQFVLEEGFHAVILQTHGIEHTAGGFRHAGQRIAGTRLEGKPFHHDAAEMREIAVIGELDAVRMGFLKTSGFVFPEGLWEEESRTVKRSMAKPPG